MSQVVENEHIAVTILNYGATVSHFVHKQKQIDVVLGFDDPEEYKQAGNPYFGALVGRTCNRIEKGQFTLDKTYQLPINNGQNSLHGGIVGFDKREWTVLFKETDRVGFCLISEDGDQGYPGKLETTVIYSLEGSSLLIEMSARLLEGTATIVNLTSHPYFNLTGEDTIQHHRFTMYSEKVMELDEHQIPTGKTVEDPFFLLKDQDITNQLQDPRLASLRGFDHFYIASDRVSSETVGSDRVLCEIVGSNGLGLRVKSDQFGFQFYTGNWIQGNLKGKAVYRPFSGFCIEPSAPPNAPKTHMDLVKIEDQTWTSKIVYELFVTN
ncbi:galactose mutarotase-like domain-containing protein [Gorgonomyces haynaldii]|nr:galactose mutarotase-like domain-containing protein [Gorgonomyces haynaldii]